MHRLYRIPLALLALAALLAMPALPALAADDIPRITKEELKARLDAPGLVILDERSGADWQGSEFKIKGARRFDPNAKVADWAEKLDKSKEYVLYCA